MLNIRGKIGCMIILTLWETSVQLSHPVKKHNLGLSVNKYNKITISNERPRTDRF